MPDEKDVKAMIDEVVALPEMTDEPVAEIAEESVPEVPYVRPSNANVQLAPSKKDQALNEGLANVGRVSIKIPSKKAQIVGFYVDNPNVLINQYPQYKYIDREKKVDKTKKAGV